MVIPGLIEMHCHILPGVDDGAKDTETSVKMLRRLALQGAETVVLTPHYYSDSISLADFTVTFRSSPAAWWRSCNASVLGSGPASGV